MHNRVIAFISGRIIVDEYNTLPKVFKSKADLYQDLFHKQMQPKELADQLEAVTVWSAKARNN